MNMKIRHLLVITLFVGVFMGGVLVGPVLAQTVAGWLRDGIYVSATPLVATAGKIPVGDGTSFPACTVSGDVTIASGGAVTIANGAVTDAKASINPVSGYTLYDDFLYGGLIANFATDNFSNNLFGFWDKSTGSGAAVDDGRFIDSTHPGIVKIKTGTDTTGVGWMDSNNGTLVIGGFAWSSEFLVRLSAVSDGTDTYVAQVGFGDNSAAQDPTNGITFRYTHGTNSGKWQAICRSAGTSTTTDTGVTATAATWTKMKITVNAAGNSVGFYIAGNLVVTTTTNIPSGLNYFHHSFGITKSAGTNDRDLYVDYVTYTCAATGR